MRLRVRLGLQTRVAATCLTSSLALTSSSSAHRCIIFGIPSQLKAWIDRIAIAGKTFSYTADGPIGLAGGKRVIVASSRGGLYAPGMPFEANDFQEKYLRAVFAFIGIPDIEIIRAEGLALSPAHRDAALNAAHATIPATVAAPRTRHAA
jgi:FMN-dependent NADH-azoreductase